MNKYIILLIAISLFSCNRKKPAIENHVQVVTPELKETGSTEKEKMENIVITESERVEQLNEVVMNTKELKEPVAVQVLPKIVLFGTVKVDVKERNDVIQITSTDRFSEKYFINLKGETDIFIETDVDGNGFNEFYIVSNTGDIAAFSSYNNKSFGQINISKKPFSFYSDCTKVKFWEAKNKKLSITFENGAGELNTVRYKLKMGEASYQLVAE